MLDFEALSKMLHILDKLLHKSYSLCNIFLKFIMLIISESFSLMQIRMLPQPIETNPIIQFVHDVQN